MDISNFSPKEEILEKGREHGPMNVHLKNWALLLPWFAILDKSLEPFLTCYMGTIITSTSCILKGWNEVVWTEGLHSESSQYIFDVIKIVIWAKWDARGQDVYKKR